MSQTVKLICSCGLTNWAFVDQDDLDGTFFIQVHTRDEGHYLRGTTKGETK